MNDVHRKLTEKANPRHGRPRVQRPSLLLLLILLSPLAAYADGGGPLLLIVNGLAFLYGSIIIVLVERGIYCWFAKIPPKEGFFDSLIVNFCSTIIVGLAFPALIAIIGGLGAMLPGITGQVFLAIGTWLWEGTKYTNLTIGFTFFWLFVTFLLTIRFEASILVKRWENRSATFAVSASILSWRANTITYGFLFIFLLVAFILGLPS